jgi:hypothetical protein
VHELVDLFGTAIDFFIVALVAMHAAGGSKGLTWCALDDQFHLRHVLCNIFFNLHGI